MMKETQKLVGIQRKKKAILIIMNMNKKIFSNSFNQLSN